MCDNDQSDTETDGDRICAYHSTHHALSESFLVVVDNVIRGHMENFHHQVRPDDNHTTSLPVIPSNDVPNPTSAETSSNGPTISRMPEPQPRPSPSTYVPSRTRPPSLPTSNNFLASPSPVPVGHQLSTSSSSTIVAPAMPTMHGQEATLPNANWQDQKALDIFFKETCTGDRESDFLAPEMAQRLSKACGKVFTVQQVEVLWQFFSQTVRWDAAAIVDTLFEISEFEPQVRFFSNQCS